jgi:hypothetical protein
MAAKLMLVEGKGGWGWSRRAPRRVDAATRAELLALLEKALDAGTYP